MDGTTADQSDEQEELLGAIVVSHTSKEQLKVNIFGNFLLVSEHFMEFNANATFACLF